MLEDFIPEKFLNFYDIEDDQHHLLPYILQLATNLSTGKVEKWV